jgi:acetyltransferase-like isoleucine patch superfamily enzyme
MNALVRANARIGHNSIIGAKSFVTRDIPPNSLAAGTPAKVIRSGVTWSGEDSP